MCELEQYVMMLREGGGPLSPRRILLHMRSINCHIGDGSQEDAHEFLRSVEVYQPIVFPKIFLSKILVCSPFVIFLFVFTTIGWTQLV